MRKQGVKNLSKKVCWEVGCSSEEEEKQDFIVDSKHAWSLSSGGYLIQVERLEAERQRVDDIAEDVGPDSER